MTPCKPLNASCICGFQNYNENWASCVVEKCTAEEMELVIDDAVARCSNLKGSSRPSFSLTRNLWARLEKAASEDGKPGRTSEL